MSIFRFAFGFLTFFVMSGIASAATVTLSFEVVLNQTVVGSTNDPAGMNGATVSFTSSFADGSTWQNSGFGSVFAVATSHSFTISGASVAASNGTYSDPSGLVIESIPGVGSQFLTLPFASFDRPEIILGSGQTFTLGFDLSPVSNALQPVAGDFINASHFAASFGSFNGDIFDSSSPNSNYFDVATVVVAPSVFGGSTNPNLPPVSIPAVPIPPTLPMFVSFLELLGLLWRQRSRAEVTTA